MTLPVVMGSSALGSITNAAAVVGNEADLDSSNNFVTQSATIGLEADMAVTLTRSPSFLIAGGRLSYQLTITNQGRTAASDDIPDPFGPLRNGIALRCPSLKSVAIPTCG